MIRKLFCYVLTACYMYGAVHFVGDAVLWLKAERALPAAQMLPPAMQYLVLFLSGIMALFFLAMSFLTLLSTQKRVGAMERLLDFHGFPREEDR